MARRLICTLWLAPLLALIAERPAGGYIANDRWNNTATDGATGTKGTPITLTWSIAADGTLIPDESDPPVLVPSNLISFLDTTFGAGPGGADFTLRPWFPRFQQSFDRLGELAGVTYVYEPQDSGAFGSGSPGSLGVRGDVRIGGRAYPVAPNTLATNYFPDYSEMMINTTQGSFFSNSANNYRAFRNTIMHESMHGLGISHIESSTSRFLIEPFLGTTFDGPQLDDVLALQRLYGDVLERSGGNNLFTTASPLGAVSPISSQAIGALGDSTVITLLQTDFISIDDDSDADFFSFTLSDLYDVNLTLTPRGATYQIGPQGGAQSAYDSKSLSNLSLALFDTNGTTLLASSDAMGLGGTESLLRSLSAGTYYARVKGANDDIQLYGLNISAVAPPPDNLSWTGNLSGAWDVATTANFDNGAGSDVFRNLDHVTFGDGAATNSVVLSAPVSPGSTTINAASNYVFSGPGGIVAGSLTVNGGGEVELANNGNSYAGPTEILAGMLTITGDANAMVSPINVAAGATLLLDAIDAAGMSSPITVQPGGTLHVGTLTTTANVLSDGSSPIANFGTMRVLDSERIAHVGGSGQIRIENEASQFQSNATFTGIITVGDGAIVEVLDDEALGTETGDTIVNSGGAVLIDADVTVTERFVLSGNGAGGGALRVGAGRSATLGSVLLADAGAEIHVEAGAHASISNGVETSPPGATLVLQTEAGATLTLVGGVALDAGGLTKRGEGIAELNGPNNIGGATIVENGLLRMSGAGDLGGQYHVHAGAELEVLPANQFLPTATLRGRGQVAGDIVMPGAIVPGDGIGALTFRDNLTLTASSSVAIELFGLQPETEYDVLRVLDAATLGGMLEIDLTGGFMPADGSSFTILEASSIVGTFADSDLPSLDGGLHWEFEYLPDRVMLVVSSAITYAAGDFNEDGSVDGADLDAWETGFGRLDALHGDGDADGDQTTSGADFLSWQRQVTSPTPVQPVPEPATATLGVACLIGAASIIRRLRRA